MVLSLTSCAYNPKKLTPHFIDTNLGQCRMYVVAQTRPTLEFKFEKSRPLDECNGFVALPLEQMLEIKRAYEARRVGGKPVAKTYVSAYDTEIEKELEALGGINLDQTEVMTEFK